MPVDTSVNQLATTVSQKISAGFSEAAGTVAGATSGTLSTSATGSGSILTALTSKASQLTGLNLSAQGFSAAASQIANALDTTSTFKGLPRAKLEIFEAKPEQTRVHESVNVLKFPSDLGIHFIALDFKSFSQNSPVDRVKNVDPLIIHLPMSPNLRENYSVSYKTPGLDVFGSAADEMLKAYFATTSDGGLMGKIKGAGAALAALPVKDTAAALVSKAALAAAPTIGAAVEKNVGASLNPNLAVLFDSMNFRKHSFTFKLFPKTEIESVTIKRIIREIRDRMVPKKLDSQFLGFPDKVDITIYPSNPFVSAIKTCVIESMSVNYAPNGLAFFRGASNDSVCIDLELTFMETEILFNDKVAETIEPKPLPSSTTGFATNSGGAATGIQQTAISDVRAAQASQRTQ